MLKTIKAMKEAMGVNSLLSAEGSNPKVDKNVKVGVLGAVLHLAPHTMSGYQTCPMSSAGCRASCLMSAGNPAYLKNKTIVRIARTKAFFEHRGIFMNLLALEIAKHLKSAKRQGLKPSIRLNGTSDLRWECIRFKIWPWVLEKTGIKLVDQNRPLDIINMFPDVQFMDYTKLYNRKNIPSNYYLTFSMNETNRDFAKDTPMNVAVVFGGKLPDTYLGRKVIDGDLNDYRPQDPDNVVVGLKAKGLGRKDDTGFVVLL